MSRRRSAALSTILALVLLSAGCGSDDAQWEDGVEVGGMDGGAAYQQPAPSGRDGEQVTLYDHGMQMARSQITIPSGWRVNQDIATDPSTGRFVRYVYDIVGPNGELVRNLPMATYQSMLGQSFDPMWRDGIVHALTGALEGVALGPLQPSATLQRLPVVQQAMRAQNAQPLEASIQASRQGTPYAGVVYVLNMPFPEDPRSGVFTMGLIVAPPQLVQPAIEANLQMALSTRPNPQFEQAYAEINRRVLNQMQVDHQRRMANNQAQFDAHQRRMKANSDAFDARNRQWMQDFRNSGGASGGSGNGYSHQDAYIDTIRETETFYDPDSGQNVQLDGYQDRTFTDNLGNFYRTDDPSFDPNSMQGSWQEVQPLQPGQ